MSRRGLDEGPIDEALKPFGLERQIVAIVDGFSAALALARGSDLIATVPERHTGNLRAGMRSFPLPVAMPEITISLLWHPRLDADPAHRWLAGAFGTPARSVPLRSRHQHLFGACRPLAIIPAREITLREARARQASDVSEAGLAGHGQHLRRREEAVEGRPAGPRSPLRRLAAGAL